MFYSKVVISISIGNQVSNVIKENSLEVSRKYYGVKIYKIYYIY